jgi:hypothetical protein
MGDGGVFRTSCAYFFRPVEELEYTRFLKSTFTEASHVRGFKTWQTPATYPECVFCGKMYRWGTANVECHMDPNISKATTGRERVVSACAESQSTSCGPNRTRFLAVQAAIRTKMQCDKKSLLTEEDASKKHNLMVVGGHADNDVDLCAEDNADAKRPCLGKGQTMLTKQPSQDEFEECWSESIIKNGLSPSLVDDPLFRKILVKTARMGQSAVCMGKGIALGKRDTTLTHHHTFSRKIIPVTDKRLDAPWHFSITFY